MKRLTLVASACLLAIMPLPAQDKSTNSSWTVEGLVAAALAHNAELKAYEAEVAAARGQRTQAGFFKNPEISTEIGAREVRDGENILQGNGTTFSIAITQTFEFPGKGSLRKAIANKNIEIAELGLEQFRIALAGKVRVLAYEYLAAQAESQSLRQASTASQNIATALGKVETTGARQTLDRHLLQASLAEVHQSIREAATKQEEAQAELSTLLGIAPGTPLPIRASLSAPPNIPDSNALVLTAQKTNPLLKIRRAELDKTAKELTAARLEVAPDLAIGPFFSRDVAGETEQNIGAAVSATIPVWDWNTGNIATAKARQAQSDALRVQAERQLDHTITRQARIYALIQQQLSKAPVSTDSGTNDLAAQQYESGAIDVWRYLEVQKATLSLRQITHAAILDAWRVWLDLNLLTGGSLENKR